MCCLMLLGFVLLVQLQDDDCLCVWSLKQSQDMFATVLLPDWKSTRELGACTNPECPRSSAGLSVVLLHSLLVSFLALGSVRLPRQC